MESMKLRSRGDDILRSDGLGRDGAVAGGRLLIVDDHELLAQSLAWSLRAETFEVTVVVPSTAEDIYLAVAESAPDVVLLDLELHAGIGDALPLIGPLRERGTLVVMLTGVTDRVRLAECLEAGAAGLLSKAVSFDDLVNAVREVVELGSLVSAHRRADLMAELRGQRRDRTRRFAAFERLTPREQEVLVALLQGRPAEVIAKEAYVSIATVRSQIRAVLQKLNVNSQLAAVALAHASGWPKDTAVR